MTIGEYYSRIVTYSELFVPLKEGIIMVERSGYLEQLRKWKDDKVIKVVTGIRRCGKSTLLKMFQDELRRDGVGDDRIISINFEDLQYEGLLDHRALHDYVCSRLHGTDVTYVFLDEVQQVPDFQKAVDSLFIKDNVDLYITGSNAYLLSGEIASLLSGRYIEIGMLPLSFREYLELRGGNAEAVFADYMKYGGLPYVATLGDDSDKIDIYLEGIYNTVIVKDIEERQRRKESDPNKRKINDATLLKNISRFLAGSVGSPISVKSISDFITSGGRKISQNTVDDYLNALVEPFIFYPAERFDVIGKQLLKKNQKMYIVDLGLRRHLLARKHYDLGFSLENIVFLELLRRGYSVNVGKVNNKEIDFVARRNDELRYYQVAASVMDGSTFEREMDPLMSIGDNYPKMVLTLDRYALGDYNGVEIANAIDWLLGD